MLAVFQYLCEQYLKKRKAREADAHAPAIGLLRALLPSPPSSSAGGTTAPVRMRHMAPASPTADRQGQRACQARAGLQD